MNKKEFIEQLSQKTSLTKSAAGNTLDTILDLIVATAKRKEKVTFTGFGTFEARQMKATTRINPRTGQRFHVDAKITPKFRAGKAFKDAIS